MEMSPDERREKAIAKTAGDALAPPAFYYDGSKYFLDTGREFIPMDQRSVSRHLKAGGADRDAVDLALNRIQVSSYVSHAGPLAGHHRGLHHSSGKNLLAIASPEIIRAAPGPWPTLRSVIEGLLGRDPEAGKRQVETFMGWLKEGRESLSSGKRRPGQCLVLAGPPGSGKSLLIDITEIALGGRRANPYPHFSGRTAFNGDLAGAELLAVDDEAGSTDIRSRRNLAASIKSSLFSGAVRIEGKHRDGFVFRPCWRMVIPCNDEPENLLVIPPLTEDVADKLTLLRCHKRPLPMRAHTLEERERFFATLKAEMPAMLHWLEGWKIPSEIRDERCGVAHYHHPHLVAALGELSPESALLALVDSLADASRLLLPWTGTAAELKAILVGDPLTSRDADRLLGSWTAATGVNLGRLDGGRVSKLPLLDGIQRWRVSPRVPSGEVEIVSSLTHVRA